MKIKKIEVHRVIVTKYYDINDDEIIEEFESVENFSEKFAEEDEDVMEFLMEQDYDDRDDNWISDNKGFTEESWEFDEDLLLNQFDCIPHHFIVNVDIALRRLNAAMAS